VVSLTIRLIAAGGFAYVAARSVALGAILGTVLAVRGHPRPLELLTSLPDRIRALATRAALFPALAMPAAVTSASVTSASLVAASVVAAAEAAGEWASALARGEVPGVLLLSSLLLSPIHRPLEPVLATALTPAAPLGSELFKRAVDVTPVAPQHDSSFSIGQFHQAPRRYERPRRSSFADSTDEVSSTRHTR